MNPRNALTGFILCVVCLFLSACETTNVRPIGAGGEFVKESDEERMWKRTEEFEEILLKSGFIYQDKELEDYLNTIVNKLLPEDVKATGFTARVRVLKDPDINAFVLPNGSLFVHTGLLASIENEAQLATALGHEMTHFINRHSLKYFRSLKNTSAFFSTLYVTAVSAGGAAAAATGAPVSYGDLAGLLVQFSFISSVTGYSQDMEWEADERGFEELLKNNYDINEAPKVFDNLNRYLKEEKIKEPFAFSDHPRNKERADNFRKLCKENADKAGEKSLTVNEDGYNAKIKFVLLEDATLDIKKGRFKWADRSIERFIKIEPQSPRGYYCLGEMFAQRKEAGDLDKAIENYKKAITQDNNFASAHRGLGLAYLKSDKKLDALPEFESYLALSPNAQDYKYIEKYVTELKTERKE